MGNDLPLRRFLARHRSGRRDCRRRHLVLVRAEAAEPHPRAVSCLFALATARAFLACLRFQIWPTDGLVRCSFFATSGAVELQRLPSSPIITNNLLFRCISKITNS